MRCGSGHESVKTGFWWWSKTPGRGIPEQALTKIFKRFYSERPPGQFGEHSGLGLAISKQIVEAHGGVIWAENIRPTHADVTSEPLGARFVVGLPV